MEIEQTYQYLKQIRRINLKIRQLNLRRDTLKSCLLPSGIDYSADKIQSTPSDKLADILAECEEIEKKIINTNADKLRLIKELTAAINTLDDEIERAVLSAYYVDGVSMNKAAVLVGYELSGVYKLRKRGVKHLSAKI